MMSQLGTRISGWPGDDLDIQAVLSGLARRGSRRYDEQFWKELLGGREKRSKEQILTVPPEFGGEGVGILREAGSRICLSRRRMTGKE